MAALADTPVVLLNGARQTGKSTLAARLTGAGSATVVTLDEATALAAATAVISPCYRPPSCSGPFRLGPRTSASG